jgi:hypothetical protein
MATVATLTYGAFPFSPVPQVGWRESVQREGQSRTGTGPYEIEVTCKGQVFGANLNEVQTKIALIQAALRIDRQVLYFHDGSTVRFNTTAYSASMDAPPEWHQLDATYTIVFYIPLLGTGAGPTRSAPYNVSYGAFNFAVAGGNTPFPTWSREVSIERPTPLGAQQAHHMKITLAGFFEEGSFAANKTKSDALAAAMAIDGSTLTFGTWGQTVKPVGYVCQNDLNDLRLPYTATFEYIIWPGGPYAGVYKMASQVTVQRVHKRVAWTQIPYYDTAQYQDLGKGPQVVTAAGNVEADTLANAQAAAVLEIATAFALLSGGFEEPGNSVVSDKMSNRVSWTVAKKYPGPELSGGLYGTGI